MNVTMRRSAATALTLGLAPLVLAAPSAAAPGDHFVVDTQFFAGQSRVTHATGSFADCRLVKDLGGAVADLGGGALRFTGDKRVLCGAGAKVLLHYVATFSPSTSMVTGTWSVTSSSLAGVDAGDAGTVVGDPGCTTQPYAGDCIRDTFTQTS